MKKLKLGIIAVVIALGALISYLVINQQREVHTPDETRVEPTRQASSPHTASGPVDRYTDPSIAASAQELAATFYQAISDVVAQLTGGQDGSSVTLQQVKEQLENITDDSGRTGYEAAQGLLKVLARRLGLKATTQEIWTSKEFTDRAIEKALMLPREEFIEWLTHSAQEKSPEARQVESPTEVATRPETEGAQAPATAPAGTRAAKTSWEVGDVRAIYTAAAVVAALIPTLTHAVAPAAAAIPSVLELAEALENQYGPDLSAFDADLSGGGPQFVSILEQKLGTTLTDSQKTSILGAVRGVTLRRSTGVRHDVFAGEIAGLLTGPGTDAEKAAAMEQHVKRTLGLSDEEFQAALEKGVVWETICSALERTAQDDASYQKVAQAVEELRKKLGKPRCGESLLQTSPSQ